MNIKAVAAARFTSLERERAMLLSVAVGVGTAPSIAARGTISDS